MLLPTKKEEAKDDLTNFRKLSADRIDLVVCDKYVGEHILKTELGAAAAEIEFMEPPLRTRICIFVFQKFYLMAEKSSTISIL